MTKQFNKEEYNKMCAEFLGFTEHIPNEKRRKWNDECYPDLPYYRLEYNVPIQFGHDYVTPTALHFLYKDAEKIPRLTEIIAVAKMKFHSDWNWIMEVIEKIESIGFNFNLIKNGDNYAEIRSSSCYDEKVSDSMDLEKEYISKKEAVVHAIWEFLNLYKENKE